MPESGNDYILVVDDVAFVRRLFVGIISELGHKVEEAESGEQALELITINPPRLIFLDLMMPQMSGFDVCEWIRANEATKKTPVVICTANRERMTLEHAIRSGATDILCKPVTKEGISTRLKRHLHDVVPQPESQVHA